MSNRTLFDVGSHAMNKLSSVLAKYERDVHRQEREIERLKMENERLRGVIEGMRVCANDDADAKDCPLYDDGAPYCCKMGQTLKELGIDEG